jgi:hypothetical protein
MQTPILFSREMLLMTGLGQANRPINNAGRGARGNR